MWSQQRGKMEDVACRPEHREVKRFQGELFFRGERRVFQERTKSFSGANEEFFRGERIVFQGRTNSFSGANE